MLPKELLELNTKTKVHFQGTLQESLPQLLGISADTPIPRMTSGFPTEEELTTTSNLLTGSPEVLTKHLMTYYHEVCISHVETLSTSIPFPRYPKVYLVNLLRIYSDFTTTGGSQLHPFVTNTLDWRHPTIGVARAFLDAVLHMVNPSAHVGQTDSTQTIIYVLAKKLSELDVITNYLKNQEQPRTIHQNTITTINLITPVASFYTNYQIPMLTWFFVEKMVYLFNLLPTIIRDTYVTAEYTQHFQYLETNSILPKTLRLEIKNFLVETLQLTYGSSRLYYTEIFAEICRYLAWDYRLLNDLNLQDRYPTDTKKKSYLVHPPTVIQQNMHFIPEYYRISGFNPNTTRTPTPYHLYTSTLSMEDLYQVPIPQGKSTPIYSGSAYLPDPINRNVVMLYHEGKLRTSNIMFLVMYKTIPGVLIPKHPKVINYLLSIIQPGSPKDTPKNTPTVTTIKNDYQMFPTPIEEALRSPTQEGLAMIFKDAVFVVELPPPAPAAFKRVLCSFGSFTEVDGREIFEPADTPTRPVKSTDLFMFAPLNVLGLPTVHSHGEYTNIGGISPLTRLLNVFSEQEQPEAPQEATPEPVKEPPIQILNVYLYTPMGNSETTLGTMRASNYTFPIYSITGTGTIWSMS